MVHRLVVSLSQSLTSDPVPGPVFQFGDFELDSASFQLLRKGRALPVERKPMELLILLVSRRGELVARADIAEKLWQSDVFVDTDHGINTAIRKLRRALRDDADVPLFIQTVTGMGYRFVARVTELGSFAANATVEPPVPARAVPHQSPDGGPEQTISPARGAKWIPHWKWISGFGVLALSGVLAAGWLHRTDTSSPRITRSLQLTSDGREKFPMLATDGVRVYFAEVVNAHWTLSAVPVSGGEPVAIPLPFPDAQVLSISPDRSELLVAEGGPIQDVQLWRVPILGGTPRRLGIVGHAGSWSPNGGKLAFTQRGDVYIAKGNGSEARKIELPACVANTWAWNPRWSPDGKHIRFERYVMDQHVSAIWEISDTGANPHLLLPDWQKPPMHCCGEWSPDGSLFYFDAWTTLEGGAPLAPAPDIWVKSEKTGLFGKSKTAPTQITAGPAHFFSHAFSPDGKALYALSTQRREELSQYNPKLQKFAPYPGIGPAHSMSFSPDGWIAYVKFPQGELWRKKADGTEALQLTYRPMMAFTPQWSPDGKQILFCGQEAGQRLTVYVVSPTGGLARKLFQHSDADYYEPNWSPDGKLILFTSDLAPAPAHLEIFNWDTQQISKLPGSDGLSRPRWSPDGKYVSALTEDGKLMLFDRKKSTWTTLRSDVGGQVWSRDAGSIFLISSQPGPAIIRLSLSDRKEREVASLKGVQISDTLGDPLSITPQDVPLVRQQTALETEIYALFWDSR